MQEINNYFLQFWPFWSAIPCKCQVVAVVTWEREKENPLQVLSKPWRAGDHTSPEPVTNMHPNKYMDFLVGLMPHSLAIVAESHWLTGLAYHIWIQRNSLWANHSSSTASSLLLCGLVRRLCTGPSAEKRSSSGRTLCSVTCKGQPPSSTFLLWHPASTVGWTSKETLCRSIQ